MLAFWILFGTILLAVGLVTLGALVAKIADKNHTALALLTLYTGLAAISAVVIELGELVR